jgi:hypothetical protein
MHSNNFEVRNVNLRFTENTIDILMARGTMASKKI